MVDKWQTSYSNWLKIDFFQLDIISWKYNMDNDSCEGIQVFMKLFAEGKLIVVQIEEPNEFADATYQEPADVFSNRKFNGNELPTDATAILKTWLFEHVDAPYPSDDEKADLMDRTGLTLTQVNNWFSNARRRTLKKKTFARPTKNQKKRKRSMATV